MFPRLLDGRSQFLKISKPPGKVVVFTKEEIKTLLAAASERTQLYILLMLNCGMTQKDVSDLLVSEVDWDEGRVIRKRSKTADEENVPVVNYKLWPEAVLRLLRQERRGIRGPRAAQRQRQPALVGGNHGRRQVSEGRQRQKRVRPAAREDEDYQATQVLQKTWRPCCATTRNTQGWRGCSGHAPQGMADRHYVQVPQGLLDQAIEWLGKESGLV